jgi:acyl-coenzyme A thioesterase PaaI-like protein
VPDAFVSAMLYDTVGPALLATLEPDRFQSTLELKTPLLRPVKPGRLVGHGRVLHRVADLAFLEASLADAAGVTVAIASATARMINREDAESAA